MGMQQLDHERGASLSVFVTVVMMALFLVAGLVVDGGAQVRAHRHAEVVAAQAARSGVDATAASRLVGQDGSQRGIAAARAVLDSEGIQGTATMSDGVLTVTTHEVAPTSFLQLIGIDALPVDGSASAQLRRV